ncbi:MAG: cytochrome c [Actinomycetota bacterium]|nr:cytochrome c [Actinomycetota bacterium]
MVPRVLTAACFAVAVLVASGCGSATVKVAKDDPTHQGAVLFAEKCGMCHTLDVAGTQGSSTDVTDRERIDGPNFDARQERKADVLFAIANGGFSGAIMPENIVTGPEAEAVADFLEKYSGKKSKGIGG